MVLSDTALGRQESAESTGVVPNVATLVYSFASLLQTGDTSQALSARHSYPTVGCSSPVLGSIALPQAHSENPF